MDLMDASFLIPTNRDIEYVKHVADTINIVAERDRRSVEILILSKEEVEGDNITWFSEPNPVGPIAGYNYLAKHSNGDFMYIMVDDHAACLYPENSLFKAIEFIEQQNNKYKISSLGTCNLRVDRSHNPGPCRIPINGEKCGNFIVDNHHDIVETMRFPVIRKDTWKNDLKEHIWNPKFYYHAADLWLSYWMYKNGQLPKECSIAHMDHYAPMMNCNFQDQDCNTYYQLTKERNFDNYLC